MIDAAHLAAAAPPGGVLPPAEETTELAYLDLRADCADVAESKARAVAAAFGPSLYLRASLRLVIACGEIMPAAVAGWFAAAATPDPKSGKGLIATVRGENVLDRLEELMLAGCNLGETSRPPLAAWAPAPAIVLREAMATGASVVVSRFAPPDEVSTAAAAEKNAEAIDAPLSLPLELLFADGYALQIDAASRGELAGTLNRLHTTVADTCTIRLTEYKDFARLDATASKLEGIAEFAQRFELAAPVGSLGKPLLKAIAPRRCQTTASVPRELLEFGVDARPASEWSN